MPTERPEAMAIGCELNERVMVEAARRVLQVGWGRVARGGGVGGE